MGPEEAEVDMVYISSGKGSSQRYVRASVNCGVCFKTTGGQDRECTCVPLEYSDQQTQQPYSLAEPYVITSIGQSYSQINPFPTFTAWGLCCGGHRHCGGYTAPPCIQTMRAPGCGSSPRQLRLWAIAAQGIVGKAVL